MSDDPFDLMDDLFEGYDRQGNRISFRRFTELKGDLEYLRLGREEIGDWCVSTVWLGSDHRRDGDPAPVIFETALFKGDHVHIICRYHTKEQALTGHQVYVKLVREGAYD
jgi:hypothetical protein